MQLKHKKINEAGWTWIQRPKNVWELLFTTNKKITTGAPRDVCFMKSQGLLSYDYEHPIQKDIAMNFG